MVIVIIIVTKLAPCMIRRHGEKLCRALQCTCSECASACTKASSHSCQQVFLVQERGSESQQQKQPLDAVCMVNMWWQKVAAECRLKDAESCSRVAVAHRMHYAEVLYGAVQRSCREADVMLLLSLPPPPPLLLLLL